MPMTLMPDAAAPALSLPLVGGGTFTLNAPAPRNFTLLVFYRGHHCPVCKGYLGKLEALGAEFSARGVDTVAISSNPADLAAQSKSEWGLPTLKIACGLTMDQARAWGLYVSKSIRDGEPGLFNEPGLFLVRPDGRLFYVGINSMPFGRPDLQEMLQRVDFVLEKGYPARGSHA